MGEVGWTQVVATVLGKVERTVWGGGGDEETAWRGGMRWLREGMRVTVNGRPCQESESTP